MTNSRLLSLFRVGHRWLVTTCLLGLLLSGYFCAAQNARWDLGAPGSAGAVTVSGSGGLQPLLAQPGVSLAWCNYPANAIPCTNFANTYISINSSTLCPTSSPIVLQYGSSSCVGTSDNLGNLGVYTLPGSYAYTLTVSGVSSGPYVVTVPANLALPVSTALGGTGCNNNTTPGCAATNLGYITIARPQLAGWMFSRTEALSPANPISVTILGDSQAICYNALTACATGPTVDINRWAEQLRIQLQADYGSHGTGAVPLIVNVGNTHVNSQYWTLSGSTLTSNILGPTQTNGVASGSSLVQMTTAQVATFHPSAQYTAPISFNGFNVYCATNSSSGSLAVAVDSVGAGTACASTTGTPTAHIVSFSIASLANHSVTLTCTGTCYLYAAEGTIGTSGVSVHNLATASAAAEYFGTAPATQLAFSDLIPAQLVIIVLGTNDVNTLFGYSVTSYTNAIQAILTHEAGLSPSPSVLIVQPPVSNVTGGSLNWPIYSAALFNLAQTNSAAYVNIQTRWGTSFSAAYFCSDQVHPCDFGSLDEYSMIGASVLDATPTLPSAVQAQSFNAVTNGANPGNAFFNASCAPTVCDAGVTFSATGASVYAVAAWSSGNISGLSSAMGLLDSTTLIFPWNTNGSDDVCMGTPISGGNVASCTGAGFHYTRSSATAAITAVSTSTVSVTSTNGTELLCSGTLPTIASGFNTTGTIGVNSNGTCSFFVQAGTGAATSTGVLTLPTATAGWSCFASNFNRAAVIQETASSPTSVTLTNFGTTFAATNFTNSDVILVSCFGR